MTLKPTDMLEIQSAIDQYERKFPRRPAPSAEEALAWRLGKRELARRQVAEKAPRAPGDVPRNQEKPDSVFAEQECNRLVWAWNQVQLKWHTWSLADDLPADTLPWVRKAMLVGWWGVFAVLVASIFYIGAMVGGFK